VRAVADDQVCAGIYDGVRKLHHIATILALIDLVGEGQRRCALTLAAAVERDDHDVVTSGQIPHDVPGAREIVELM
jgi:hypothetical protein